MSAMRKSCRYCGHIHDVGYACPARPCRHKQGGRKADAFRSTYQWQRKREQIKERDHHLCQWCQHALHVITSTGIEVHHIEPLEERPDLCDEDENLISLCTADHKKADAGVLPRARLHEIARANGGTPPP